MKIRNLKELETRIEFLEERRIVQEQLIAAEFSNLRYELRPANLIKNAWKSLRESPESGNRIIETVAELGISALAGKWAGGGSKTLLSSLFRAGAEMGLNKLAEKHSDKIRAYGTAVYNSLFKRKNTA